MSARLHLLWVTGWTTQVFVNRSMKVKAKQLARLKQKKHEKPGDDSS